NMDQGWEAEVQLVVDAAYPTEHLSCALEAFIPQSKGCRVQLREEVLSGVEEQLHSGSADLAISSIGLARYLPQQPRSLQFPARALPPDALHQLRRTLSHLDLEGDVQGVMRDSCCRQRWDEAWLGAEQLSTVTSLSPAAKLVVRGLGFA